jgi:hypothetical protein
MTPSVGRTYLKWTPRATENIPRPHRKLTTELDADPIKLFLGAIDPMNPQDLVRAVAGPALDVQT